MKQPINVEEKIHRQVGRRVNLPSAHAGPQPTPSDAAQWREHFGGLPIPRGIHRFTTHEAADAWLWKMITRPRPH